MNKPIIHEGYRRQVITDTMITISNGQRSGWSIRFESCPDGIDIGLYWANKATPTHHLVMNKEALIAALKGL